MMKQLTWPELKLACNAILDQSNNAGCWLGGKIPDIFYTIMDEHYPSLKGDPQWLSVIEAVVKQNAVYAIAKGEVRPPQR